MSAQLDFPPIAEAAPSLAVVATAQPAAADLAQIDLQAVALAQFGNWRNEVEAAKKKLTDVVLDLSTQSKVDEAKSLRQRTVNTPIAEVRKVSKALKSKLAGVSKAIGAEEEAAVAAWTAVGELLTPQIDARQAQLDEERARKAHGEAFRKALHMALIERIKGYVEQAAGLPSERIGAGVTFVQGLAFGDECQEFLPQYRAAHESALATLITMRNDAKAREDAEALRLENERVAAELAAQKQALENQAAELLRQRVAVTHAAVFTFPNPEEEARAQHEAQQAEAKRIQAENDHAAAQRTSLVQAADTDDTEAQQPQQVLKAEPATADATDRGTAANESPRGGAMGAGQAAAAAPAGEPATLKLGSIGERLGFTLTEAFVSEVLGIKPSGKDKRAVMFKESDFGRICDALQRHIQKAKAGELQAA